MFFFPQGWASLIVLSAPSLRYFQLRAIYPFLQHYIFVLNSSLYYMHTAHQPPNAIYGCYWLLPDSKWLTATRGQHFNLSISTNQTLVSQVELLSVNIWIALNRHQLYHFETNAGVWWYHLAQGLGVCFLFRSLIQERRKWAQEYKHYSHKLDSLKKKSISYRKYKWKYEYNASIAFLRTTPVDFIRANTWFERENCPFLKK